MKKTNKGSLFKRLWDLSGSRNLSVFIFVACLTYTLFLVIFSTVVPLPWVENIAALLPFKVLYTLFFVNLIVCEIKWIPVILRRCRKPDLTATDVFTERFRHKIKLERGGAKPDKLVRFLKKSGYQLESVDAEKDSPSLIYALKGRFSPLGNFLFHVSAILLLIGVFVSMLFRFEGSAMLTEGYGFSGSAAEYSSLYAAPFAKLPSLSFHLDKITPEFWDDKMLFTALEADLQNDNVTINTSMSSPAFINGSNVSISSLGITPMFVLKNKGGRQLDTGYVNMSIFVPGTEDSFQVPGLPHKIFVSYVPDFFEEKGKIFNRSMNPVNPGFWIRIMRGRLVAFSGFVPMGEEIGFENFRLSFPQFIYWGTFKIIKDPGNFIIWIAFVLSIAGLIWKLLFYRKEVAVVSDGDSFVVYGSSDYYQSLFENELKVFSHMEQ